MVSLWCLIAYVRLRSSLQGKSSWSTPALFQCTAPKTTIVFGWCWHSTAAGELHICGSFIIVYTAVLLLHVVAVPLGRATSSSDSNAHQLHQCAGSPVTSHSGVKSSSTAAVCRYLPIGGFKPYIDVTMKLAYGDNADVLKNNQVAAVQACSLLSSVVPA